MRAAIPNPVKGAVIVLVLLSQWVHAGEDTVTSAASEARQNFDFASEDLMLPVFAPESEADKDLGVQLVMQPQTSYEPFRVNAYAGYGYTNNAGLEDTDRDEDHYFHTTALISYTPVIRRNLYGEFRARGSTFRYQDRTDLDFETLQTGAGVISVFRKLDDLTGFLRYNYTEYSGIDPIVSDSYSDHGLEMGLFKSYILSRNQFVYATWLSEFSLDGEPDFARRDEHSVTFGYRLTPIRKVKAELFARTAFLDFSESVRQDWNQAFGGSLTYNFTPSIYVSGYVSWTDNQSNVDTAGYEVWNPGLRLGGNWRF